MKKNECKPKGSYKIPAHRQALIIGANALSAFGVKATHKHACKKLTLDILRHKLGTLLNTQHRLMKLTGSDKQY